jgi:4-amino-4-deoxy-L-arabinose transferase-like glycosyltransferase
VLRAAVPLLVVFGVAFLIRLLVVTELWNLPLVRTPKLDSAEYLSWATRLASGDFSSPVVSPHSPGYPLFLAALLVLCSGSLYAVSFAQSIVGALTAVMIGELSAEWFGRRAAIVAGLIYAVNGPAVYVETMLLSEGLLLFLLTGALCILCRRPLTRFKAAAAGVALGAATIVRPTALIVVVAILLWMVFVARRNARSAAILAGTFLAAGAIVVLPFVWQNWAATHRAGIQGYGGLNFYIGNSPLHSGRPTFRLGAGWDTLNAEAARAGIANPAGQDRYYVAKTLREIEQHPVAFVRLAAEKCIWLVQAEEVRDSHSFYFFADQSRVLRWLPGMSLLFPLASLGVLALVRSTGRPWLLVFYASGAALSTVALVVGTRYRMPIVPALAVLAGGGSAALAADITARRLAAVGLYAAVAMVALAATHVYSDPRDRNLSEEWAFTGSALVTEHNLTAAEAAYRRAIAIDSTSGLAWDGLGMVFYNGHRPVDARDAFQRAVALDPESSRSIFHLALVADQEGNAAAAIAGYRAALALAPFDLDMTRRLGGALLKSGQAAEALPYLQTVAAQAPADPDAHRAAAVALASVGRLQEARAEMMRVTALVPASGEAWLDLSLLSADLRDLDAADVALQRAREWGASPERVAFAAAAITRARGRQ